MKIRQLKFTLQTVTHPDHPDRVADGVLVYYTDDAGVDVDLGIIERQDLTIFTIQADAPTLGISLPDMARILKLMLAIDDIIAQLKTADRQRVADEYNGIPLSELHLYN